MAAFLEQLLGGEAPRQEPGFRLWSLPDGDILELASRDEFCGVM